MLESLMNSSKINNRNELILISVYPKERHGVRNYNSSIHLDMKVLSFLENL